MFTRNKVNRLILAMLFPCILFLDGRADFNSINIGVKTGYYWGKHAGFVFMAESGVFAVDFSTTSAPVYGGILGWGWNFGSNYSFLYSSVLGGTLFGGAMGGIEIPFTQRVPIEPFLSAYAGVFFFFAEWKVYLSKNPTHGVNGILTIPMHIF